MMMFFHFAIQYSPTIEHNNNNNNIIIIIIIWNTIIIQFDWVSKTPVWM